MGKISNINGKFSIKDVLAGVDKEENEQLFKEAKNLLVNKRQEINRAKKILRRLQAEETDLISQIEQGL